MNIERVILQVLEECVPQTVREDRLLTETNLHLVEALVPEQFLVHLTSLSRKKQVAMIEREGHRRWSITAAGAVRLKEAE